MCQLDAVHRAVELVSSWCGVTVESVKTKNVWSSDVYVWRVCGHAGGFVYVDVGRRVLRTCCTAVQAGICDEKFAMRNQPAIAVVSVCTQGSPDGCIAPHTLANLFHELGHAFHHVIGCTAVWGTYVAISTHVTSHNRPVSVELRPALIP